MSQKNTAENFGGDTGEGVISGRGYWLRFVGALGFAALLLVFLVAMRWLDSGRIPEREFRTMDTIEMVALPAPPPPPARADPAPPTPPEPRLPKLEIRLNDPAPPLPSSPEVKIALSMVTAEFEWEIDPVSTPRIASTRPKLGWRPPAAPPRIKSVYSSGELDAKPKLLNRPTATFPRGLYRKGIREGRVLLEVSVSTSGRVTVLRVLQSSQPEFAAMARSVASRARFTVPKKDGRPVTAIYKWPLILKP